MTAGMIAPAWMRQWITAEQYESWSEERCAGVERSLDHAVAPGGSR